MSPKWEYSVTDLDVDKTAKASGRDLRISPKAAREICRAIRDLRLDDAKRVLQDAIDKKRPIPYRRHRKEVPHQHGLQGWSSGKFPVKAAGQVLEVLENAEANAEFKGLDLERLRIIHAAAQQARKLKRYIPRAFGRSSPYFDKLTHIEIVLEEAS